MVCSTAPTSPSPYDGACPVSLLPRLARALKAPIDVLVDEEAFSAAEGRSRRGPPSRLKQQLQRISQLPKSQQKFVSQMLDTVLAQHAG